MSHARIGRFSRKDLFSLPDGVHRLERNFYLRVRANGKYRTYFFRYTDKKGIVKDCNIGSLRKISMMEAKQKVYFLRTALNLDNSICNMEETISEKIFKDFANETIVTLASVKLWKNPEQQKSWASSICTYAFPIIGEKFLSDISRADILKILGPIWIEKTMMASRLRGRLEKIFSYAIHQGLYVGVNPASWKGNLEMYLPPPDKCSQRNHFKALSFEELKKIVPGLSSSNKTGDLCLLFGILTATRTIEFTQIHWREIDWNNHIWLCPPSRRKDGKKEAFRVPLSDQAMSILRKQRKKTVSEYVFSKDGLQPLRRETPRKILKESLKLDCTMHGMRSTFRDWCIKNGIDEILAEKSLMHSTGNAVVSAYQRSDLLEERRIVMQNWANSLFDKTNTKC